MGVEQKCLAVFNDSVSVLEVGLTFADRLYFRSPQRDTGLEFLEQEIVVASGAVHGGISFAGGYRFARFDFLGAWFRRLTRLTRHTIQGSISMLARGLRSMLTGSVDAILTPEVAVFFEDRLARPAGYVARSERGPMQASVLAWKERGLPPGGQSCGNAGRVTRHLVNKRTGAEAFCPTRLRVSNALDFPLETSCKSGVQ